MLGLLLLQVLASCLWLGHSEVVKSFADCPQFFCGGTTPNDALHPDNPAWICQRFSNSYHYATLYDRDKRIPVYSAYKYQPGSGKRPHTWWFVEPQEGHMYDCSQIRTFSYIDMTTNGILTIRDFCSRVICFITCILSTYTFSSSYPVKLIYPTYPKDMDNEKSIENRYRITPQKTGNFQAISQNYNHLQGLEHGQLSPSGHKMGNNSKWATFTLTNIVPQDKTLSRGAWRDYEIKTMIQKPQGCTTTYVITGAVPGNTYISNNRVNVPSHIWLAACCQTNTILKTWAVIADNTMNQVQNLTLTQLEASLSQLYEWGQVSLFLSVCPH